MKDNEYENIKAIVHSDFLDKPAINTIYYAQSKQYIKCPHCSKPALVDDSKVLTSYPPKYSCKCEHCGEVSYIFCHELAEKQYNPEKEYVKSDFQTRCKICGYKIPRSLNELPEFCDECKAAIIEIRRKLGTWND